MTDLPDVIPASQVSGELQSLPDVIPASQVISRHPSDLAAIRNAGVKGAGSLIGIAQELFAPQFSRDKTGFHVLPPHLFGLGPSVPKVGQSMQEQFETGARNLGILDDAQPASEYGKFGSAVAENTAAAGPFGIPAAIVSGLFGGTGQYAGEKVGEKIGYPTIGKVTGSFLGGMTPQAVAKLGIVKELGEQLGPIVSQLPLVGRLFGDAPVQAAVGRALGDTATDVSRAEEALRKAVSQQGPIDELTSLRTTAEIAGDKGLARAQDAIEAADAGAPFKTLAERRAKIRADQTLKGFDPSATAYDTSKALEGVISKSADEIGEVANAAWKALPIDQPVAVNLGGLNEALKDTIDNITFSGAVPIEGSAKGLLTRFNNLGTEGQTSLGALQKLRSQALAVERATGVASDAERTQKSIAGALASHLDDVIDNNVSAGLFPENVANAWRTARSLTKSKIETFAAPKAGTGNLGTKGLEQVALKGQPLNNTELLREGLNSPDKMVSHIQAAAAGGEDVRPLYKQALQATLEQKPQTQWADTIAAKRNLWEMVFSKDEMANLDRNLADIESQLQLGRNATTTFGNSATNPRGNVQAVLNREKGIGNLVTATRGLPALGGAYYGATEGWDSADTTIGKVGRALVGGALGAAAGKALNNAAIRASDKFDSILTEALRDPRAAIEALESAKPSQFIERLRDALADSAKASAIKGANSLVNNTANSLFQAPKPIQQEQAIEDQNVMAPIDEKKEVILDAISQVESGGNVNARSPAGAEGEYQFMPAMAKAYNVNTKDGDSSDDREGAWDLLKDEYNALGSLELALAAYNAGRPKVLRAIKLAGSREWPAVQQALLDMGIIETAEYVDKYKKLGVLA